MKKTDESIQQVLKESYEKYKDITEGKNASYIPCLAKVDPKLTALTVVTVNGDIYSIGDDTYPFAIESISKVCTLALAMEQVGVEKVRTKIGDSPTGLPFNSVMALELHKDKPLSPLVNAGAMSTVSILKATSKQERWESILKMQQRMMTSDVKLSDLVNHSEQTTNFHNRAIAWLLYSAKHMFCDPMEACEVYTQQCSTLVTSKDLAILAATLANGGQNPISKEQVVHKTYIPHILAEMVMEGLYVDSGDFAYTAGLPGKSGVGGGLLAVVPNVLGIAAFAPPLDAGGNSVKGLKMITHFVNTLGYSLYLKN